VHSAFLPDKNASAVDSATSVAHSHHNQPPTHPTYMKFSILRIASIALTLPFAAIAKERQALSPSPKKPATADTAKMNPNNLPESEKGKFLFGTRVPGRPGFIYSPYDKKKQFVDVAGVAPGVIVRCPYSDKLIRVPEPSEIEKRETRAMEPSGPLPATTPKPAKAETPKNVPVKKPAEVKKNPPTVANPAPPKSLTEEPESQATAIRTLSKADAQMLMPSFIEGRPLVWIEQEPNSEGRQTLVIVEKRGDEVVVVFDWTCTTGRNSLEGGESFPTPSTFDSEGNVGAVRIVRKDKIRPGIGLEWALELEFYDHNGNLRSICIHKGIERHYASSHGCIRLNDTGARRVFDTMQVGDNVVITGRAISDNPYVTYVAKGGKKQAVPVFKIDVPEGTKPPQEDIDAFVALLRLPKGHPKKMQLDHMPFGVISEDKTVVRFRFEHMPRGTGITMAKVEKLTGMDMWIGPVVKRPPGK
jgi:hypothetical protein